MQPECLVFVDQKHTHMIHHQESLQLCKHPCISHCCSDDHAASLHAMALTSKSQRRIDVLD